VGRIAVGEVHALTVRQVMLGWQNEGKQLGLGRWHLGERQIWVRNSEGYSVV
jgi:hypothetical protein